MWLEIESENPVLLYALDSGRRRFAIHHAWHPTATPADVIATTLHSSLVGNSVVSRLTATLVPENRNPLRSLVDGDSIALLLAHVPDLQRSMGARTYEGLSRRGLMLTTGNHLIRINPVKLDGAWGAVLPLDRYRHVADVHHTGGSPIPAATGRLLIRQLDAFLHFLLGRSTYPSHIRVLKSGMTISEVVGPVSMSHSVVQFGWPLGLGGAYESHELTFEAFTGCFRTTESLLHLEEALRWRDTAARGVTSLRIAAAFTALERLGLMATTGLMHLGGSSEERPLSASAFNSKYEKAHEKLQAAFHHIKDARDQWLSPAYTPLEVLARKKRWQPWHLLAKLRNLAVHSENHAEFAGYSRSLAGLAARYAVDAFDAILLEVLGFEGFMPTGERPFDSRSWIRFPLSGEP